MEEQELLRLFEARDEKALAGAQAQYGSLLRTVGKRILGSAEDAEECLNDTLLAAWRQIPPDRPRSFPAYLCKIARNTALRMRRDQTAEKRGGGELPLLLDELEGCLPGGDTPEAVLEEKLLREAISAFLASLSRRDRGVFLCRYFYGEQTASIAARYGEQEANILLILSRTRRKLKTYLKKEHFI